MTEITGDLLSARADLFLKIAVAANWSEQYRRRYDEDGQAMTCDEAVEAFRRIGDLDPYPALFPHLSHDPALLSSLNMICEPCSGVACFREPAVRAIIEGFERAIAENSKALYILHDGEAEPREVGSRERFLAYEALRFFVEHVPDEDRNGTDLECFDRAEAILARATVTRPRGRPTSTAARNERNCTLLRQFEGCGLPVTSSKSRASLAAAMAEVTGIPETTICDSWRDADTVVLRPDRRSRRRRSRRCDRCGDLAGEGARRVGDDDDKDLLCRACQRERRINP